MPGGTRVTFSGTGALQAGAIEPARDMPPRLVIDFPDDRSSAAGGDDHRHGPVDRVRVAVNSRNPLVTRAVIDLKYPAAHRVEPAENGVVIVFDEAAGPRLSRPAACAGRGAAVPRAGDGRRAEARAAAPAPAPAPEPKRQRRAEPRTCRSRRRVAATGTRRRRAEGAGAPSRSARRGAEPPGAEARRRGAPAKSRRQKPRVARGGRRAAVHRAPGDVRLPAGRSALGAADVLRHQRPEHRHRPGRADGTVDVSLREVPWDQALEVILRSNQLGYVVEHNVVRIAPLKTLAEEERTPEAGRSAGAGRPAEGASRGR